MHMLKRFLAVFFFSLYYLVTSGSNLEGLSCARFGVDTICTRIKNCSRAIESMRKNGTHGLISCGFADKKDELVCCPVDLRTHDNGPVFRRKSEEVCKQISEDVKSMVQENILRGEDAKENEFPHMAALGFEDTNGVTNFMCGATIVSKRFLLSAAHCFIRREPLKLVRLGVTKLNDTKPKEYGVKNVTIHHSYNISSRYHDIALVEVDRDIDFVEEIYPACLNVKNETPSSLTVIGWGKKSSKSVDDRSNILQKATVFPTPQNACNTLYTARNFQPIRYSQICAGSNESDACEGDSGGPLQIEIQDGVYSIIGVVSTGMPCEDIVPGIYTRVSEYIDWIESKVWPSN